MTHPPDTGHYPGPHASVGFQGPRDVRRQEMWSGYWKRAIRAKMRALVSLRDQGVNAMHDCSQHDSCTHYARLRSSHTEGASDTLSATVDRELEPHFDTLSTKVPAMPCVMCPLIRR